MLAILIVIVDSTASHCLRPYLRGRRVLLTIFILIVDRDMARATRIQT